MLDDKTSLKSQAETLKQELQVYDPLISNIIQSLEIVRNTSNLEFQVNQQRLQQHSGLISALQLRL